jgi:hypothetical protein
MTQQQDQYSRALARAQAAGLKVLGRGTWTNGATFHVVTSASEAGRFHLVTQHSGRLSCDCVAGQHGRMCLHRAIVHEQIERERQAEDEQKAQATAERRETAMLTTGRADNKAFSIWAS